MANNNQNSKKEEEKWGWPNWVALIFLILLGSFAIYAKATEGK